MKLAEKNPQIGKAVSHLMALSEDEQTRMLAESREKLQRDIAARENAAVEKGLERGLELGREKGLEEGLERGLEQGREEGREEGREKAQLVIARRLLGLGLSIDEIVKATELPPDAIRTLH